MKRLVQLSVLLSPVVLAVLGAGSSEDRLEQILAKLKHSGDSLETFSARFEQTDHDFILEEEESSVGKLYLSVPGSIRWEYIEPNEKVLLVKEELVQLYNKVAGQVQEFDGDRIKGSGAGLLVGFGSSNEKIRENYDVRFLGETDNTATLKLIPKPDSGASVFTAIELTLDKQRWIPVRSVFHEANKDRTVVRFDSIEINGSLPSGIFELQLPPGVEFIKSQ